MAKAGQTIDNPVTGQRITFVKTVEEAGPQGSAEVEWIVQPGHGPFPAEHLHPTAVERFEIISGNARYRMGHEEHLAGPGDAVILPARLSHLHPWNVGDELLRMHMIVDLWPLSPAERRGLANTQTLLVGLFALARAGKVDRNGLPPALQYAVMSQPVLPYAYAPGLPIPVQNALLGALAAVGRWRGYAAEYPVDGRPAA